MDVDPGHGADELRTCLPQYVRPIRAGGVNTMPRISVQKTAAATALVDGDNGIGHLVVSRAAETAIALASDAGIGWVGVCRSNHAGTAGLYGAIPVAYGMIGLYAAVANANHMAVWGGSEPLLGNNPLGIGLPSDSGPVRTRYGDVRCFLRHGEEVRTRGPGYAGGLADRYGDRPIDDRSEAQQPRPTATDRWLQGAGVPSVRREIPGSRDGPGAARTFLACVSPSPAVYPPDLWPASARVQAKRETSRQRHRPPAPHPGAAAPRRPVAGRHIRAVHRAAAGARSARHIRLNVHGRRAFGTGGARRVGLKTSRVAAPIATIAATCRRTRSSGKARTGARRLPSTRC
jgi:hypothetical protein